MSGICIVGSRGVSKASLEAALMACDAVMVGSVDNYEDNYENMVLKAHSLYIENQKLISRYKEVPHYRDLEYGRKNKKRF